MANAANGKLAPGLYLVATPIGNARDITLRALDVLRDADVLAAEDTRTLRRLLDLHSIPLGGRRVMAHHDHSAPRSCPAVLAALQSGKSVAYASDAGTPIVSDPGFDLVSAARAGGFNVTALPGPSAFVTALSVGGIAAERFFFAGFLPNKSTARRRVLTELATIPSTLILYESPHRIADTLADASEVFGPHRLAALCRELTKKFEEVRRGTLSELGASVADVAPKGELVLVIEKGRSEKISPDELDNVLKTALTDRPVKDVAAELAEKYGLPRRDVYQRALALKSGDRAKS